MSIIKQLKPRNYEFINDQKYASLNLPKGNHYGLIAQDLEEVLPALVKEVST
ncbi:MAG: tail fiber domain-containing protein [Segetibacter sp.]